jgi:hypothetical protein
MVGNTAYPYAVLKKFALSPAFLNSAMVSTYLLAEATPLTASSATKARTVRIDFMRWLRANSMHNSLRPGTPHAYCLSHSASVD